MNQSEIKKALDSEVGRPIKDFLLAELIKLRQIDNLTDYETPTAQSIEIKAQKKAFNKLKDILEEIMTIGDADIKKSEKDRYDA